jgi:hypothetical protein
MFSNMHATFTAHTIFLSLTFFIIYGTVMQRLVYTISKSILKVGRSAGKYVGRLQQ